jgi:phosphopentomutase
MGSDTFGHIYENALFNRNTILKIPNLKKKGFLMAAEKSRQMKLYENDYISKYDGSYGYVYEKSSGKDTISGHWEIAGCPYLYEFNYFKKNDNSYFPIKFIKNFLEKAKLKNGIIDGGYASGTEIINKLGDKHVATKKPIIYTSGDSVLQIAAHEKHFGINNLYRISKIARETLDQMRINIARVISRPFINGKSNIYERTKNRRDYSIIPPKKTLLDIVIEEQGNVISIGKISDIFSGKGISKKVKADGITNLFDKTISEVLNAPPGSVVFTNFVDFDSTYGHRRNINGYAKALEYFDSRLTELDKVIKKSDMVVLCADHGCDPSWYGSDHTRENVPFLFWGKMITSGFIGHKRKFSDIGATIADFLDLKSLNYGNSCLNLNKIG